MEILITDFQEYNIALGLHNPQDGTRHMRVTTRDAGQISDGYHTFDELYRHRHLLFFALLMQHSSSAYKSRLHHDGSNHEGYFVAGCDLCPGVITYHAPNYMWDLCPAPEVERAPEWDGHTSNDMCDRLRDWISRSAPSTQ